MKLKSKKSRSLALRQRYGQYVFGVTPFRRPIMARADGNYYTDVDGKRYLDLMSGQFGMVLGHNNKKFNHLVTKQLNKIIHTSTLHLTEEVFRAMANVASVTAPSLNKVLILSTGAEAVECALRHAKYFNKKDGVVGIGAGYHGLTLATQSISSNGLYARPHVPLTFSIPTPDWLARPPHLSKSDFIKHCLKQTQVQLAPYKGKISAFVFEPIISVGGMIYPPRQYFIGLRKIAQQHQALLISDECQTGLGRTGTWFGYEQTGIVPDILVLAKNAGLGLPVSVVVFNERIAKKIEGNLVHFSTHQNDPIGALPINFLIDQIKTRRLLPAIRAKGRYFLVQLEKLAIEYPVLVHPRGQGLMLAFDLPGELFSKQTNPGRDLVQLLENRGVNIQATRQGRTFRILPSYTITKNDIDFFIRALREALEFMQL